MQHQVHRSLFVSAFSLALATGCTADPNEGLDGGMGESGGMNPTGTGMATAATGVSATGVTGPVTGGMADTGTGTGASATGTGTSSPGSSAGTGDTDTGATVGASADEGPAPEFDKLVALTFDDGPNPALTGLVLDKLEAHDVPASFFLVGQQINAGAQATLDRAAALGCEFENHSSDFNPLDGAAAGAITTAIDSTNAAIEQATGVAPVFFRPPNLAISQLMYQTIDMPFAGGIVGGDFPGGNGGGDPTVESVTNTILNGVQDGAIILLHDSQPGLATQVTPDALDIIIPDLKMQGYEIVTLRQLFERRGVDPNSMQDQIWNSVPPS